MWTGVLAAVAAAGWGTTASGEQEGVEWREDFAAAAREAGERGRLVLVYFHRPDRPVCRMMERETFGNAEVRRAVADHYVAARVDATAWAELFEQMVGGTGGLAVAAAEPDGEAVSAVSGFVEAGPFGRFLARCVEGRVRLSAARTAVAEASARPADVFALGEAYRTVDNPRKAEESYRRLVEGGAGDAEVRWRALAHERLGRLRAARGRNLEARAHVEAYRKLDPDGHFGGAARAALTEAMALEIEMRYAEAAAQLAPLAAGPDGGEIDEILYHLGAVKHEGGEHPAALETLERLVREFPESLCVDRARERIGHIRNPPPGHVH